MRYLCNTYDEYVHIYFPMKLPPGSLYSGVEPETLLFLCHGANISTSFIANSGDIRLWSPS